MSSVFISSVKAGELIFYAKETLIYRVAIYIGYGEIVHAIDEQRGIGITSMYFATPYCAVTLLE